MSYHRIKRTVLDKMFSDYIRETNNWTCARCGKKYNKYESKSRQRLDNSHYFGRIKMIVRFEVKNCDPLCKVELP